MTTTFNQHGIAITKAPEGIYLYALISSSDNYEIELLFENEEAIKKEFGKDLFFIDTIDLIAKS